jgi:hypothetical protein
MHQHASTCLQGPVSRSRRCWKKGPTPTKESSGRRNRPVPTDRTGGSIRHDLVARVRAEIAAGTYDTPEKWQAALDSFLERHLQG